VAFWLAEGEEGCVCCLDRDEGDFWEMLGEAGWGRWCWEGTSVISISTLAASADSSLFTGAVLECLNELARLAPPFGAGVDGAFFAVLRLFESAADFCGGCAA
jgi:hypothetical protein